MFLAEDPNKYPLSCGSNYNESMRHNLNSTCACVPEFSGINCGDTQMALGTLIAISAGVISAIVIAALIIAGIIAGGGVAAMYSYFLLSPPFSPLIFLHFHFFVSFLAM